MPLDIMIYFDSITEHDDEKTKEYFLKLFDSLDFKIERNNYHFGNISNIIKKASDFTGNDHYEDLYLPVYYEMEGLLTSMRSTVDMLLHLLNAVFFLDLDRQSVTLYGVYHHKKLPKIIKNIFDRYTRPKNNPTWEFIYSFRNEIVHEKSIHQILPLDIEVLLTDQPTAFLDLNGIAKDLFDHFKNCLRFLETFAERILSSVEIVKNSRTK